MKKFYTFALSAIVAFSAAAELKLSNSRGDLTPVMMTSVNSVASQAEIAPVSGGKSVCKTPAARAASFTSVNDLLGNWNLEYYSFMQSNSGWQSSTLTFSAVPDNPNQVSIVGLYGSFPVIADVDLAAGTVSIPKQFMFTNTYYNKDVYFYVEDYETEVVRAEPAVGTLDAATSTIAFSENDVFCVGIEGLGYFLCGGYVTMTKPDASYEVEIVMDDCADNDTFNFSANVGASATKLKYYIINGMFPASSGNLTFVAQNGNDLPATSGLSLNASAFGRGAYTLFIVSVDDAGNAMGGDCNIFYVYADDADNWTTLEGDATYSEDLINSLYKDNTVPDYKLAVQVNNATPGLFRLVNPYGEAYPNASGNMHSSAHTHNHYLYINASNPDKVVVDFSPLAFDYGDGSMYVNSMVNYILENDGTEADCADYYGKYDTETGIITMPAKSLIMGESRYNDGAPNQVNANGLFKVVLPESAGVNEIVMDVDANAPVEYFNAVGQRIDKPAAGQFVIVRQGTKISKMIVK